MADKLLYCPNQKDCVHYRDYKYKLNARGEDNLTPIKRESIGNGLNFSYSCVAFHSCAKIEELNILVQISSYQTRPREHDC